MPVLALGPLAFAIREDLTFGSADIGATYAGFFVGSSLFAGIGARLTRRILPTTIVRLGLVVNAGITLGLAAVPSRAPLILLCVVSGVVNGLVAPAVNLQIMGRGTERRRGPAFGIKTAAVPAAASFAAVGAYLVASWHVDWRVLFIAWAAVGAVLSLTISADRTPRAAPTAAPAAETSMTTLRLLGIGGLLGSTGTGVLAPFLVEGLIERGQTPGQAATLLVVSSWLGITSRVCVGVLSDRFPDPLVHLRSAALLLVTGALGMAGLAFGSGDVLLVGATVLSFGLGWSWPGLLHFAALASHPGATARAAGYVQTGTFLGAVLGPLCFGLTASHASFAWAWSGSAVAVVVGAVLLLCSVTGLSRSARERELGSRRLAGS